MIRAPRPLGFSKIILISSDIFFLIVSWHWSRVDSQVARNPTLAAVIFIQPTLSQLLMVMTRWPPGFWLSGFCIVSALTNLIGRIHPYVITVYPGSTDTMWRVCLNRKLVLQRILLYMNIPQILILPPLGILILTSECYTPLDYYFSWENTLKNVIWNKSNTRCSLKHLI